MASPYIEREKRLVALSSAMRDLRDAALREPPARAAAYAVARLAGVTADEDAEALRRVLLYWRRIRPAAARAAAELVEDVVDDIVDVSASPAPAALAAPISAGAIA